jgi:hypothetical protein
MSVNTLNFEQVSTVLTSIIKQATGQTVLTPTDTGSFVSVAQVALRADRDAVMQAIGNVIGRTIFSVRPYSAKMTGLMMDTFRWGNVMRKLSIADKDWQDDPAYEWPALWYAGQTPPSGDGQSIDPWTIKKPDILQTNFYGASVYFDEMTIFEDQLETAFQGPEQLASFLGLIMTNLSDRMEQSNEGLRRGLVANAIASVIDEGLTDRVVHLLTEYNIATGQTYTAQQIYQPSNFAPLMKWVYSRIAAISALMTERSQKFQTIINNKPVLRHTPYQDQRVYMYAPARFDIDARVLADTFHDNYLRYADVETVNYWQSIDTPDTINITPAYTDSQGVLYSPTSPVSQSDVFGLIFDRDCMGMTTLDNRVLSTVLNSKGLYRNLHVHSKRRVVQDLTEKCVVFLLD